MYVYAHGPCGAEGYVLLGLVPARVEGDSSVEASKASM